MPFVSTSQQHRTWFTEQLKQEKAIQRLAKDFQGSWLWFFKDQIIVKKYKLYHKTHHNKSVKQQQQPTPVL